MGNLTKTLHNLSPVVFFLFSCEGVVGLQEEVLVVPGRFMKIPRPVLP